MKKSVILMVLSSSHSVSAVSPVQQQPNCLVVSELWWGRESDWWE